jgi:predicted RNA-binding Zn ribbon-like protein
LRSTFEARRLDQSADGYRLGWEFSEPLELDCVLWPVVESAVELLAGNLTGIKVCQGLGCGWLFIDSSKARRRRWCSMNSCGNKEKYRRRTDRQGPTSALWLRRPGQS